MAIFKLKHPEGEEILGTVEVQKTRSKNHKVVVTIHDDEYYKYTTKIGKLSIQNGGAMLQGLMNTLLYQSLDLEEYSEILEEVVNKARNCFPNVRYLEGDRTSEFDIMTDTTRGSGSSSSLAFTSKISEPEINELLKHIDAEITIK